MLSLLRRARVNRPAQRFASPEVFAIVTGLALAFIPVVPVAMTRQYQGWFVKLGVTASSHSILCYFGISLVLAGLVSALFRAVPTASRAGAALAVIVALTVGILAVTANRMSDAIAADMRPEAARWRVFALTMDTVRVANLQASNVLAPRFRDGGWFTVVPTSYWSDLARLRYGMDVKFVEPTVRLGDLQGGLVYLDYLYLNEPRSVIVILAKLRQTERQRVFPAFSPTRS